MDGSVPNDLTPFSKKWWSFPGCHGVKLLRVWQRSSLKIPWGAGDFKSTKPIASPIGIWDPKMGATVVDMGMLRRGSNSCQFFGQFSWQFIKSNGLLLLFVQKSGEHQLRLIVYSTIYRVLYIPGGCLGFLPSTDFPMDLDGCWDFLPNLQWWNLGFKKTWRSSIHGNSKSTHPPKCHWPSLMGLWRPSLFHENPLVRPYFQGVPLDSHEKSAWFF